MYPSNARGNILDTSTPKCYLLYAHTIPAEVSDLCMHSHFRIGTLYGECGAPAATTVRPMRHFGM